MGAPGSTSARPYQHYRWGVRHVDCGYSRVHGRRPGAAAPAAVGRSSSARVDSGSHRAQKLRWSLISAVTKTSRIRPRLTMTSCWSLQGTSVGAGPPVTSRETPRRARRAGSSTAGFSVLAGGCQGPSTWPRCGLGGSCPTKTRVAEVAWVIGTAVCCGYADRRPQRGGPVVDRRP